LKRGFLYFAWVIPGILVVALLSIAYLRFLGHLPLLTRLRLILSGSIYVAGALGMELVGGYVADYHPNQSVMRGALSTIEEFLEMSGIVLLIYTLLIYRIAGMDRQFAERGA
jgi:hypothetical protein